jgi:hypothetical protein
MEISVPPRHDRVRDQQARAEVFDYIEARAEVFDYIERFYNPAHRDSHTRLP